MLNIRTGATLLALALAVAATPALARQHTRHPGHEAQAQAVAQETGAMAPEREKALHDCSQTANRFDQKTWGVIQDEIMAACMSQHGQME